MSDYLSQPDVAATIADMRRRISGLERGTANPNRVLGYNNAEISAPVMDNNPASNGGPSATVNVPVGGFVAVFATQNIYHAADGGTVQVWLYEPTDLPAGQALVYGGGPTYPLVQPASFIVRVATPGRRFYELRYDGVASAGLVKNRSLLVSVW